MPPIDKQGMRVKLETLIKRFIGRTSSPVVLRSELRRFGGSSQLSVVLRSLQDQGLLVRIGTGLYAKAKVSVLSGKPIPVSPLDIPFTENHIKQLHQILLRYSEKDTRHRGNYRTTSNSVAAFDETGAQIGIVFQTASPFDTPRLMTELMAWVNQERQSARLLGPDIAQRLKPWTHTMFHEPGLPVRADYVRNQRTLATGMGLAWCFLTAFERLWKYTVLHEGIRSWMQPPTLLN